MDVLIFDDDPTAAELTASICRELGYTCALARDGFQGLERVKRDKPRLAILDAMMPGTDGFALCRAIKADAETRGIAVIVASTNPYKQDREEALRLGALELIVKPHQLQELGRLLRSALGEPAKAAAAPPRPGLIRGSVWGSWRGGGDDRPGPCVSLDLGGRTILLDAGTGLRAWRKRQAAGEELTLLLTSTKDHYVAGLDELAGLDGVRLRIVGPEDTHKPLTSALEERLPPSCLAGAQVFSIGEGRSQPWPDVLLSTLHTRHPGAALGVRLDWQGRSVVYCPANELEPEDARTDFTEKLRLFVRAADVLIHDARYRDAGFERRGGRGYSSPRQVIELARTEGVGALWLFGMDSRDERPALESDLAEMRRALESDHASLRLEYAFPGAAIEA